MVIREALQHCRGIGPTRLQQLQDAGLSTWDDILARPESLPAALAQDVLTEVQRCVAALEQNDIGYFVQQLHPRDRWRILAEYLPDVSYFDIETTGLELDSQITVIVCWHRGSLHTYIEHENLDDFLDLLDEIRLLVSFNGSTFDVPRLLDAFHIPQLPCPHLDLRWPCQHRRLAGGLKDICTRLGITRPDDLQDVDGEEAVRLWYRWHEQADPSARDQLVRYCAADVLLLHPIACHLAGQSLPGPDEIWQHLPAGPTPAPESPREQRRRRLEQQFGKASPAGLRTWRRRSG